MNFAALALVMGALVGSAAPAAEPKHLLWQVSVEPAQARPGDEVEVVFRADIASGWILYSSDFNIEIGPRPARFTFDANPSLSLVGPIQAVSPKRKHDKTFGGEYSYFATHAEFRQKAKLVAPLQAVSGKINGQTCFEESGLCELFREEFRTPQ
jgi:thiol:disulfide interchange protein DsbD